MRFEPHAYQRYCIERVIADRQLGLFLDLGLGKTVITLNAIKDLKYNRFEVSKVLVIAPKKVAESTWVREASKWDHLQGLRISQVLGSAPKRIKALCTPADIYVINRENVVWLVKYYQNKWPFDMVVVDELSSFKSNQAKRFKYLSWVRGLIKRFVGLTGTPAPNGLLDLWAQLFLIDQGQRLGVDYGGYQSRYFDHNPYTYRYYPKTGAEEAVQRAISDVCISLKAEDYIDVPKRIDVTVPVILDDKAAAKYAELEREAVLDLGESVVDAGTAAVLTNKLLQLCNGAVYDENGEVAEIHKCKIEAFMETVEGLNGQSAIVFYNFKHDLKRLKEALSTTELRVRQLKTPEDERAWNAGEVDILLAHPASAAYGLNLQDGGHHIIWYGLNWSLELYQQANGRLHRQGQKHPVIIHHLVVSGGVDEDVMETICDKEATQDRLLAAIKARIERYKKV